MTKAKAVTDRPPKLMGQREYARHRAAFGATGGTHSAVAKAIASGRLVASLVRDSAGRVRIDQEKADLEWGLTTDPAQQREPDELRKPETPPPELPKQLLITGEAVDAGSDQKGPHSEIQDRARVVYSTQRARIAAAKAELEELELSERRGELVNAQKVADDYYRQAAKLREGIMNVPKLLARELGPKLRKRVERELEKVLRGLHEDADD